MRILYKSSFVLEMDILFVFAVAIAATTGILSQYLLAFAAAFLHELAHVATAGWIGEKTRQIRILAVGMNAEIEDRVCNKYERIAIYCSGPVFNGLIAVTLLLLDTYYLCISDNMRFFVWMNMYLAMFNMLPILPLDGGKIFREILWGRIGIYAAQRNVKRTSFILAWIVTVVGAIQLYITSNNFSLLIIGLYIFFALKSGNGEAGFMNIRNIVYRRSRLMKKGIYSARDLVVMKWVRMGEIIKEMDFDQFHIIHVLDEDLRVIKTYSEQEIIDSMLNSEEDMTFEELIERKE